MSSDRRVVITGLGLVTALGSDRESTWSALCQGRSAIRRLDPSEIGSDGNTREQWLGAPVVGLNDASQDPVVSIGLQAAREAMADARLSAHSHPDPARMACTLSTSKGGMRTLLAAHACLLSGRSPQEDFLERSHPGALAFRASQVFDLLGLVTSPVAACAGGVHSLIQGYHLISEGQADVVLAGAADASLILPLLAAYDRMGVLSHSFDDPAGAIKPFDARRDGFAVGEGAAAFVMESVESARARKGKTYGELTGWARGSDAYHLTALAGESSQIGRLLGEAMTRARVSPAQLGYINAHGTATRINDSIETRAIHEALGKSAGSVPVSSTKAATGHLLGAAGALEAAVALLALRDGCIPPTLNLHEPDRECDLDYVPLVGRRASINTAASISAGFGGQIGVVVFSRSV